MIPYVCLGQLLGKLSYYYAVIETFGETFHFYYVTLPSILLTQSAVAPVEVAITLYESPLYTIRSDTALPPVLGSKALLLTYVAAVVILH